jgi:putative hydrolase of the HAD superfamily
MIKNIIFDFGDVFINLDKSAPDKYLKTLGIGELEPKTHRIHKDYEKGLINTEDFIDHHTNTYHGLSKTDFIMAWNSILKDFPHYRLEFLKQMKDSGKYNLFLLSNTNDLHIKWVQDNVEFYEDFKKSFKEFYLSYEINLRKPDQDIFQFVLQQNNLDPEETLFIDDTLEHINSAKTLNINTWHLQAGKEDITKLFDQKELNL